MGEANTLTLSYESSVDKKNNKNINFSLIFYIIITYFFGQAVLAKEIYTFAFLYLIFFMDDKKNSLKILVFTIMGISLLKSGGITAIIYLISAITAHLINNYNFSLIKFKKYYLRAFIISAVHFFLYYIYYIYIENNYFSYIIRIAESLVIFFILLLIYQYKKEINREKLKELSLMILLSGFFIGFSSILVNYTDYSSYIIDSLIIVLITTISWYADMEKGVFYGVLIGLSLFLTEFIPIVSLIKYLIYALVVGVFSKENKIFYLLSLILSFMLYSGLSPTYDDFLLTMFATIFSIIFFILFSEKLYKKIFSKGLKENYITKVQLPKTKKNNISLENSFHELSQLFSEMSVTFSEVLPSDKIENKKQKEDFVYLYKHKVCKHCSYKEKCWSDSKNKNKEIVNILKFIQINGFNKTEILKRLNLCPAKYLHSIKNCYEILLLNNFWRTKVIEKQKVVAKQLDGIGNIIKLLSKDSQNGLKKEKMRDNINDKLFKKQYDIFELNIQRELNSGNLNLSLKLDPCSGNEPCKNQIKKMLENEFSRKFRLLSKKCGNKLKDELCDIHYGECGNYKMEIVIKQISKEKKSGDSYLYQPLANGSDLLALSDGMGVGNDAARESRATIKLLEKLIKAGFSRKLAIETINSTLFLRNQEDKFSTLDIVFFNTFTGEIVFNKIGSMFSFIKRNWEIEVIKPSSLPVGILENIEITEMKSKLNDGDFVIMFSDGVIDSLDNIDNREKWFKKLLQNSSFEKAKDLANYIIDVVKEYGKINDDLTIIVFKVCEINKKRRKMND